MKLRFPHKASSTMEVGIFNSINLHSSCGSPNSTLDDRMYNFYRKFTWPYLYYIKNEFILDVKISSINNKILSTTCITSEVLLSTSIICYLLNNFSTKPFTSLWEIKPTNFSTTIPR